jgi:5'-nucleotidase
MRILLTNDDGIHAPGLAVLERIAARFSEDVWICAPDEEQSGAGHSLTLTRPVRLKQHTERRFSVTGTPTDAITMALKRLMPEPPDLILSGVNRGANLGDDVTYSGTVSAAFEGALAGIRSIALSQVYVSEGLGDAVSFESAESWGERTIRPLLDTPFAPRSLVNINFPPLAADKAYAWFARVFTTILGVQLSKARIHAASAISGLACTVSSRLPAMPVTLRRLPMAMSR